MCGFGPDLLGSAFQFGKTVELHADRIILLAGVEGLHVDGGFALTVDLLEVVVLILVFSDLGNEQLLVVRHFCNVATHLGKLECDFGVLT